MTRDQISPILRAHLYTEGKHDDTSDCGRAACLEIFRKESRAIERYRKKLENKGLSYATTMILLSSTGDRIGRIVAEYVLPNNSWDHKFPTRTLYAKGIVFRIGMNHLLRSYYPKEAEKILIGTGLKVLIIAHGAALVCPI